MKNDIQSIVKGLRYGYKQRRRCRNIVSILSCVVFLLTIYFLTSPAITLNEINHYNFYLKDEYDYSWKEGLQTEFNLKLYFTDTAGNSIEGKDVTFEISPDSFADDPYSFGDVPINGETTRGLNLIEALDLKELTSSTGEKYEFSHALVYVNDTWQTFSNSSKHWDIWCQSSSSSNATDNYGWRGKYGDEVAYTINDDTKYKLVYKLVRYGQSNSVSSLGVDSGISFNIFNYEGDNSEIGINNNGLYGYFTFRASSGSVTSNINTALDADGFGINRAKVLSNLEEGYPVFNCQGQCQNASLGYLFGASTNPKEISPEGVTSYNSTNTLLQKETIDEVEYFYYDSSRNAVDYDTENNRFMLRDYVERSYSMTTFTNEEKRYEFMPFNYWNDNRIIHTNTTNNRNYNYETGEIDHWFGMTMEFSFYMPKDGTLNGKDMIFDFSGDDDVWVFIDDVLVLDLGGTHGAVDGNINFATGEVKSYLNWNGIVGTSEECTANTTNIYEMFNIANSVDSVKWNANNTSFANYTKHTLKFFYLERGASVSNCKIRFNIPVLPSGSLSVKKLFDGIDNYNEDYKFILYDTTNNTIEPVINTKYTIGDKEYYTNEYGEFTLKTDEVAIFKLNNYHTYYVEEVYSGDHAVSHSCSLDGISCYNINKTEEFTINPESLYEAIFTNEVKKFNLNISKKAYLSENDEIFEFKLILKDKDNLPVVIEDDISSKYIVDRNNGIVTFYLKSDEEITVNNIPIDTVVTLEETKYDGYYAVIKSGDILLANGNSYTFTMDSDKDIAVHNTPGVTLPETGGKGIYSYIFSGIVLIILSLKYYYKSKEGGI